MEFNTRPAAHAKGLQKYFTGEPCKNGHLAYRYTATGICSACRRMYQQRYKPRPGGSVRVVVDLHPEDAVLVRALASALMVDRAVATPRASAMEEIAKTRATLFSHGRTGEFPVEKVNGKLTIKPVAP